jgi:hypothetical protein
MAETELERIRRALTDAYGEDYEGEDTASEVERLFRHLSEHDSNVHRILQAKDRAIEQAGAAIEHVRGIHRKSLFAAANGTHRGKHYCMSCTFSADDWTYYEPYPCPTATAVNAPQSATAAPTAVTAATEAHGGAGEALEGSDG